MKGEDRKACTPHYEQRPVSKRDLALAKEHGYWPMGGAPVRKPRPVQHERKEAEALWQAAQLQPWGAHLRHIPQERRSGQEARNLSKQGVIPGTPDYLLLMAAGGSQCAWLELKRVSAPPSSVTRPQREFLDRAWGCGMAVWVARGWEEAYDWLQAYAVGDDVSLWPRWWLN